MLILSLLNCAINCLFAWDRGEEVVVVIVVFFSVCKWFLVIYIFLCMSLLRTFDIGCHQFRRQNG